MEKRENKGKGGTKSVMRVAAGNKGSKAFVWEISKLTEKTFNRGEETERTAMNVLSRGKKFALAGYDKSCKNTRPAKVKRGNAVT